MTTSVTNQQFSFHTAVNFLLVATYIVIACSMNYLIAILKAYSYAFTGYMIYTPIYGICILDWSN